MKFLQKLGKALMLPVACLPICGILMGIGYALCPATMQGGDITGIGNQIGFFPCMMFGIPGAALAMIQTAKSNRKDCHRFSRIRSSLCICLWCNRTI